MLGIPAGTTLAMFLDFSIRYDYLLETAEPGLSSWDLLLIENHRILGWGIFLPMFVGMIYAFLYQVEESQNNWKLILSLPIRHGEVYLSKFLSGLLFGTMLILFNMFGLVLVGLIMDFPEAVEWDSYFVYVSKQILAILAIASLHNWFSSYFKNMIIPIVISFIGVIFTSFVIFDFSEWIKFYPYAYSFFTDGLMYKEMADVLINSVILMFVSLWLGMIQFKRKDVL